MMTREALEAITNDERSTELEKVCAESAPKDLRIKELEDKLYKPCGVVTELLNRCNDFYSEDKKAMNLVNDCYTMIHSQLQRINELEDLFREVTKMMICRRREIARRTR